MPYYDQIQGAGNPDNPYQVIIQDIWTILIYDIAECKEVRTLVDYEDRPGDFSIIGFSYFPPNQELLFGLETNPDYDTNKYHVMKLDVENGRQVQLAEGINPAWSPDGRRIAYLGLDGLYVMQADGGGAYPVLSQPFSNPLRNSKILTFSPLPHWSADGEWLVYHVCGDKLCRLENIGVYKISSTGGVAEKIIQGGMYPAWKP
jgi:hypothetical protein